MSSNGLHILKTGMCNFIWPVNICSHCAITLYFTECLQFARYICYYKARKEELDVSKSQIVREIAEENNGIVTTAEAAERGVESWYFTEMVREGTLEKVKHGVYFMGEAGGYDDLYVMQLRSRRAVYSYQTALYLHDLADRIPYMNEATVPQGYNASHLDGMIVHYVKKEWYEIGITECSTIMGNTVKAYDMERTICDLIRDRKNQDSEIFRKAIHIYMESEKKDIWKLREYAEQFGISGKLEDILQVI